MVQPSQHEARYEDRDHDSDLLVGKGKQGGGHQGGLERAKAVGDAWVDEPPGKSTSSAKGPNATTRRNMGMKMAPAISMSPRGVSGGSSPCHPRADTIRV